MPDDPSNRPQSTAPPVPPTNPRGNGFDISGGQARLITAVQTIRGLSALAIIVITTAGFLTAAIQVPADQRSWVLMGVLATVFAIIIMNIINDNFFEVKRLKEISFTVNVSRKRGKINEGCEGVQVTCRSSKVRDQVAITDPQGNTIFLINPLRDDDIHLVVVNPETKRELKVAIYQNGHFHAIKTIYL
jgi:hypothetical protein